MQVGLREYCGSLNRPTFLRRVLIADGHGVVAEGIGLVLEKKCDVVGIVEDSR